MLDVKFGIHLAFLFLSMMFLNVTRAESVSLKIEGENNLERRDVELIRRSFLEIVMQSKELSLVVASNGEIKSQFYILFKVKKENNKNAFNMELYLKESLRDDLVNYKSRGGIPKQRFHLYTRQLLYKLLYEENFDEKQNRLIENKVIPLSSPSNISASSLEEAFSPNVKVDNPEILEEPSDEIEEISLEENLDPEEVIAASKKKKKTRKDVKLNEYKSADLNLATTQKKKLETEVVNKKFSYTYDLSLGRKQSVTTSTGTLASVKTNINGLELSGAGNIFIKDMAGYFRTGLEYEYITGENLYSTPSSLSFYTNYNNRFITPQLEYVVGGRFHSFSFNDIPSQGDGIHPWTTNTLNILVGFNAFFFKEHLKFHGNYQKSFLAGSSNSFTENSINSEVTEYEVQASAKIYKDFGLSVSYSNINLFSLGNQELGAQREEYLLSLTYK